MEEHRLSMLRSFIVLRRLYGDSKEEVDYWRRELLYEEFMMFALHQILVEK
jgi:hypothetical protein